MGRRGLDACRGRFERGVWRVDGCPAEVARCRTRRLVGRRDRFGLGAAELLVASVLQQCYTRTRERDVRGAKAGSAWDMSSSRSATEHVQAACSPLLFQDPGLSDIATS
jgi:hypothetical protein